MSTEGFTLVVPVTIKDEDCRSMLVSALEGGSNYWYYIPKMTRPPGVTDEDLKPGGKHNPDKWEYSHLYLYPFIEGGSVTFRAPANDTKKKWEEINGKTEWVLDRAAMQRGLEIMAQKYPWHFANVISDNTDAGTGDVFLQLALFSEVIFG